MAQSTAHLLIIDDDTTLRRSLSMALEVVGYRVDVAADGQEALSKCKERSYDVVFVDLQMPKMGGLELLQELQILNIKQPVVVLTAYGSIAGAVEAMKLGAIEFLEKPFEPRTIRRLVEKILKRQPLLPHESVENLLRHGTLARDRHAYAEAETYFKSAMLRDPARPDAYYWLGTVYEAEGDMRQAMRYYHLALDASPAFQPAHDAMARLKQGESRL